MERNRGGIVTWLRDAAEHGAKFFQKTKVERLLFAQDLDTVPSAQNYASLTPSAKRNRVVGALLKNVDTGKLALVHAKRAVVVSGGSMLSPAILQRSGLKNPNIGKHLYLHPAINVTGYFDELIKPWEGSIMTLVRYNLLTFDTFTHKIVQLSNTVANRDGSNYGAKLEVSNTLQFT